MTKQIRRNAKNRNRFKILVWASVVTGCAVAALLEWQDASQIQCQQTPQQKQAMINYIDPYALGLTDIKPNYTKPITTADIAPAP